MHLPEMNEGVRSEPPVAEPSTSKAAGIPVDQRVMLHMPVDVRSVSLAVLAVLASFVALRWAKEILVPIMFGVMMSYALTPALRRLQRWRIPRSVGAPLLLVSLFGALVWSVWTLSDEVDALVETLPQVTHKLRRLAQREAGAVSTIAKVQQAAVELEAAAAQTASSARQRQGGQPVANDARSHIDIRAYLLSGTLGALAFLGQVIVVFFIALFLMSSGNDFRRKMVKLAGPKLSQKKVTIETLDEISDQIQRYLVVQVGVSIVVGMTTWIVFYAIGLNQSAVWGIVAGVTNLVPYVGAVLVGVGAAVVGLVQFGTMDMALLIGGSSFAIHTLMGNVLTPWWMGRASRMSAVAVFIVVLIFGWLWGIAGLLLGVPILLIVKSVCDRVEELKPIGELLGREA
jgi:predicted PurR-regulated permease PerM